MSRCVDLMLTQLLLEASLLPEYSVLYSVASILPVFHVGREPPCGTKVLNFESTSRDSDLDQLKRHNSTTSKADSVMTISRPLTNFPDCSHILLNGG